MLAFVVSINGKKVCTAGLNEPGVVASALTWVQGVPVDARKSLGEDLDVMVGGLASRSDTHMTWLTRKLRRGDKVTIEIIETTRVDPPKKKKRQSARVRLGREQDYVTKRAAEWGWKIEK